MASVACPKLNMNGCDNGCDQHGQASGAWKRPQAQIRTSRPFSLVEASVLCNEWLNICRVGVLVPCCFKASDAGRVVVFTAKSSFHCISNRREGPLSHTCFHVVMMRKTMRLSNPNKHQKGGSVAPGFGQRAMSWQQPPSSSYASQQEMEQRPKMIDPRVDSTELGGPGQPMPQVPPKDTPVGDHAKNFGSSVDPQTARLLCDTHDVSRGEGRIDDHRQAQAWNPSK